jgi:selenocysteine lyase/cysteine desulfurase
VNYRDEYQPGALRYDVGERSNFALLPMAVAALKQVLAWEPERIQVYCDELFGEAIDELGALGFTVEGREWRGAHLFGVRMPPSVNLASLHDDLIRANVSVALRGTALRVAPNVYNDATDVDALMSCLRASVETSAAHP